MNWIPTNSLDENAMIHYAAARHLVRLDDGRIATLTAWPGGGSRLKRSGRRARVVNRDGNGYTLPVTRVVDVCGDAP